MVSPYLAAPARPAPRHLPGDRVCLAPADGPASAILIVTAVTWTARGVWRVTAMRDDARIIERGPESRFRRATDEDARAAAAYVVPVADKALVDAWMATGSGTSETRGFYRDQFIRGGAAPDQADAAPRGPRDSAAA